MPALHEIERTREWPAIVSAIPCPVCAAQPGEPCWDLHLSFGERRQRADWHSQRKHQALQEWNAHLAAPTASPAELTIQPPTAEQQPPEGDSATPLSKEESPLTPAVEQWLDSQEANDEPLS